MFNYYFKFNIIFKIKDKKIFLIKFVKRKNIKLNEKMLNKKV